MRSTLVALLALALPFATVADLHGHHARSHHEVAKRAAGDMSLHKRFSNARFTFYDVGLGACGKTNVPSDFIVALNTPQYGGGSPGPQCFKMITITANGKTTSAQIMDECPGCPYGGLDMSRGLFDFFASESVGVLTGSWEFSDGSGSDPTTSKKPDPPTTSKAPPPPPTTSSKKPDPTTTSTSTTSSKTSTSTSHTSTSTTSTSKTSSSTSKTSSSTSSSATSSIDYTSGGLAVPTGIAGAAGDQNLFQLNDGFVGVGQLLAAAAQL